MKKKRLQIRWKLAQITAAALFLWGGLTATAHASGNVNLDLTKGDIEISVDGYRQNGGDGAGAIRAGVSAGQKLTAQAAAQNPQALRWGISQEHYWKEFYKTPEERRPSRLDTQINNLLIQAGQPPRPQRSTYQEYVNRWQDFLTAIGGGGNIRA